MVLRRRGLARRATPPISLVLATFAKEYIARLDATRTIDPPQSERAVDALNRWVAFFASACTRAVADAEAFEARIEALQIDWRARLGKLRADAAALKLLSILPAVPVLTVTGAAGHLNVRFAAANEAVRTLVELDILRPISQNKRNRAFEATEIIDAFAALERQLASPEGEIGSASSVPSGAFGFSCPASFPGRSSPTSPS